MKSARQILRSLAVLIWSAVLLYFYASGRASKYLAPDFRLFALLGGLGLAVLGFFNILTANQQADASDGCGHDHEKGWGSFLDLFLMILPLGLSVVWTKDEYSSNALARKGLYESPASASPAFIAAALPPITREEIEKSHRKTPDGFLEFTLMELFFATGDREVQPLLEGVKVETEGRWIEEKTNNSEGTRKRLYRLFITCCIADSRAIPIVLEFGKAPPNFPENSWVKVSGTMSYPMENGLIQPVLHIERALAAEPPFEETFPRK